MRGIIVFLYLLLTAAVADAGPILSFQRYLHRQSLDFYAHTDMSVASSPCQTSSLPSTEDMYDFITQKNQYSQGTRENIKGAELLNQSEELTKAVAELTARYYKNHITLNCKTASCVMTSEYGEYLGTIYLYTKLKYNVNLAANEYTALTEDWSNADLSRTLITLENLPRHLFPLNKEVKITKSLVQGTGAHADYHTGEKVLRLFKPFYHLSTRSQIATLNHELAHVISTNLGLAHHSLWSKINQWEEDAPVNYEDFVSRYAMTNNDEDFAESFTAYRYNPSWLKKVSMEKYDFLKYIVFNGIEYDQVSSCNHSEVDEQKIVEVPTDTQSYQACSRDLFKIALAGEDISTAYSCVEKEMNKYLQMDYDVSYMTQKYQDLATKLYRDFAFPNLQKPKASMSVAELTNILLNSIRRN